MKHERTNSVIEMVTPGGNKVTGLEEGCMESGHAETLKTL